MRLPHALENAAKQQFTSLFGIPFFAVHLPRPALLFFVISTVLQLGTVANGQDPSVVSPPPCREVAVKVDSGFVSNATEQRQVVWSETVEIDNAKWLQLQFRDVILTKGRKQESILKITSLEDGAYQILNGDGCEQWRDKSAFFNGDAVKVELLAHAKADKNCVVIDAVTAGTALELAVPETICDLVDDRGLSNDSRCGRIDIGCTAWLFDGRSNDLITAGHCAATMTAVFFNVPLSDADGTINFPGPEDQYAICLDSVQAVNGGTGNDWCYFGVFDNSTTGLSPLAAQGDSFTIGTPDSNTFGGNDLVRVTGFGSTTLPVNPRWNLALKTHAGPFVSLSDNMLQYRPDTTGGNSGSPVIRAASDIAYGVHTHGGCGNGTGFNIGTGLNHPGFQAAINSPLGACVVPVAPPNDACLDAISIGNETRDFDTSFATTDGPALPAECEDGFGLSLVQDIWFEYTANCTGQATFDFCSSGYDTRVAVYAIDGTTGGTCPGDLLGCNDDSCGLQSELTLDVVEGETYLLRVGGFSGGGLGTMTTTCVGDTCSAHIGFVDGVVMVNATQGPDEIMVSEVLDSVEVSINSECVRTFPMGNVDQVVINGYGGADSIQVDAFVDTIIDGGSGADVIMGGPADDTISGGLGTDTVFGFGGSDEISGGGAVDVLHGGSGADQLYGGPGRDTISGGNGNDLLAGNGGGDELSGGGGDDVLLGGSENDELYGGPGRDTINGNTGNDLLVGSTGTDELVGGDGDDVMDGGAGADQLFGGPGEDLISGGNGNDLLVGAAGADELNGGGGSDELIGLGGPDAMFGGAGNDTFTGGAGFDTMDGGSGTDTALDNGEVEIRIENS